MELVSSAEILKAVAKHRQRGCEQRVSPIWLACPNGSASVRLKWAQAEAHATAGGATSVHCKEAAAWRIVRARRAAPNTREFVVSRIDIAKPRSGVGGGGIGRRRGDRGTGC